MPTETLTDDPRWEAAGLADLAARAADATLSHLGLDPMTCEISLLGCDDARIAALNESFRGKPAPTNVLSWPSEERAPDAPGTRPALPEPDMPGEAVELGDIAIAFDTCAREATEAGLPLADHATHLIVHATLHLLGYDHEIDADADLMEATEIEILASLGLKDPYS